MSAPGDRPATFFDDPAGFREWLEAHHDTAPELWMGLRKRHVTPRGLTWAEAVPVALCFGWIDSANQPIDDDARRQRWTPRRPGSVWSLVNVAHVERLRAEGLMHPAGEAAFAARRPDRTGIYSFEKQAEELTEVEDAALGASAAASAFWAETTPGYRRTAVAWVHGAKREATRESRLARLVECCAAGELIPQARSGKSPAWLARASDAAQSAD